MAVYTWQYTRRNRRWRKIAFSGNPAKSESRQTDMETKTRHPAASLDLKFRPAPAADPRRTSGLATHEGNIPVPDHARDEHAARTKPEAGHAAEIKNRHCNQGDKPRSHRQERPPGNPDPPAATRTGGWKGGPQEHPSKSADAVLTAMRTLMLHQDRTSPYRRPDAGSGNHRPSTSSPPRQAAEPMHRPRRRSAPIIHFPATASGNFHEPSSSSPRGRNMRTV